MNRTILDTKKNTVYKWYVVDAEEKRLGRISTEISRILLGKNSTDYSPNTCIKHAVIVINSEKVIVTGKKETDKFYRRHSGRPGGLTIETFSELQKRIPNRIIEKSVKGMLPKGRLGRSLFNNLKVYTGNTHPHSSQKPEILNLH